MRILVSGGTGHLGTQIVSGLQRDGHHVRVLARQPRAVSGVHWVRGDLASGEGVQEAAAGVDAIIHTATNSPAARRGRFKLGDFFGSPADVDVDVDGTKALLSAAEHTGVSSTSSTDR